MAPGSAPVARTRDWLLADPVIGADFDELRRRSLGGFRLDGASIV